MAKKLKASGSFTVVDLNDGLVAEAYITANRPTTQIYNQDTNTYIPNWSQSPFLVLTPELYFSGIPGNSNVVGNSKIKPGSVQWRRDTVLLSNSADYAIETVAPFSLTIKKNENNGAGNVKFQVSAVLIDPGTGLERSFSATISFTTGVNASAGLMVLISSETGTIFQNDEVPFVKLTADLFRGGELLTSNVAYQWYLRDAGVFAPTTTAAASTTAQKTITLTTVDAVRIGSQIKIGTEVYTVQIVNIASKVVTLNKNLVAPVASGVPVTSPHFDVATGVGWAKISGDAYFDGISGFAQKDISIPAIAVMNLEVFMVVAKDNSSGTSTGGQQARDQATVMDYTDPIRIEVYNPDGEYIQNSQGSVSGTAIVWRGKEIIDEAGTQFTYEWYKTNSLGQVDPSFTKTGKTITVTPADISGKAIFHIDLYQEQ